VLVKALELSCGSVSPAARIIADQYPQVVGFDATGLTAEQVHYFLGEAAGVAFYQYQFLTQGEQS
jgi:hypothetical protein